MSIEAQEKMTTAIKSAVVQFWQETGVRINEIKLSYAPMFWDTPNIAGEVYVRIEDPYGGVNASKDLGGKNEGGGVSVEDAIKECKTSIKSFLGKFQDQTGFTVVGIQVVPFYLPGVGMQAPEVIIHAKR